MIRPARSQDLNGIEVLYDHIHDLEEAGGQTIGWIRGVYPVRATAEEALARGDLFVMEIDETGSTGEICSRIVGAAFINQLQVDVYDQANWRYPARDEEVMVMHTLVIEPAVQHRGLGRAFLEYYEDYARAHGCRYLRIDTNARNETARAIYRKYGYWEAGIVSTTFNGIPGVDLVLLEKAIEEEKDGHQ